MKQTAFRILIFFLFLLCAGAALVSCAFADEADAIAIKETSVPEIGAGAFDPSVLTLLVTRGGKVSEEPLTEEMIGDADMMKFFRPGTHEITVNAYGASCTFTQVVKPLAFDPDITLSAIDEPYTGETFRLSVDGPVPPGTEIVFPEGSAFTEVCNNKVTAILLCDGYATKTLESTVVITPAVYDMSGVTFEDATFVYDGYPKSISIKGTLPEGVSVSYRIGSQDTNERTEVNEIGYPVEAIFRLGNRNYAPIEPMTANLRIVKRGFDLSGIVLPEGDEGYTGEAYEVTLDPGVKLPAGVRFSDLYAIYTDGTGEHKIGSEEVTVGLLSHRSVMLTDAHEYTVYYLFEAEDTASYRSPDPITQAYTIRKAKKDLSGVRFERAVFLYDGSEQSIFVSGELPEGVSVSYEGNGQKNVGEYAVTARFSVSDPVNYEMPASLSSRFTITRAELGVTTADFFYYSVLPLGSAPVIPAVSADLPDGIGFEAAVVGEDGEPVSASAAGDYSLLVTLTGDALDNYFPVGEIKLPFRVSEHAYDLSGVTFDTEFVFDGLSHTPVVHGLPTGTDGITPGVTFSSAATHVSEGDVEVTMTFTTASLLYELPAPVKMKIRILPAVCPAPFSITPASENVFVFTGEKIAADYTLSDPENAYTVVFSTVSADGTSADGNGATVIGDYVLTATVTPKDADYKIEPSVYEIPFSIVAEQPLLPSD